jgi:FkbM family methyltransferase
MRDFVRRTGFDLVRLPPPNTLERHLSELLPELEIDLVVDVGAMHGNYATMLRRIGYRGPIVSFDPVPSNIEILQQRAASDRMWTIVPLALGDTTCEAELHISRNTDLSSFLELSDYGRSTFPAISDQIDAMTVSVRRLDEIASKHVPDQARSIFLKIDTQGFDLAVFRGGAGLHPRISALQLELSLKPLYEGMADMTEGLEALRAANYEITGLFPVVTDSQRALVEVDCVARRAV